ncbi:tail fiber protein [Pedobacter sp. KR3-3]|uniref:Tail fiber protein n=1 Tax=Pedobacter albus TaxID=3113905 RepID=A0ABU7I2W2_9SPHI|nr:tail fiber protein [Pedobacter sp. KR3-3]MEE1943783.1 tail fiber protein [Pedobacter sp. KR3-3]
MDAFLGEIRIFGGDFAPRGWMFCAGQEMPINTQFNPLFQVLQYNYGGQTGKTFKLPDLRGKVALGVGQAPGLSNYTIGQAGGGNYKLSTLPPHSHDLWASSGTPDSANPKGNVFASLPRGLLKYGQAATKSWNLHQATIELDQHKTEETSNLQPSLAVNYIIYVVQV